MILIFLLLHKFDATRYVFNEHLIKPGDIELQ
jgi:hypothetical protein